MVEMVPSAKYLPCTNEDLSSIPRAHISKARSVRLCVSVIPGETGEFLGLTGQSAEPVCWAPDQWLTLYQKYMEGPWEMIFGMVLWCMHVCTCTCTCTHTTKKKKKNSLPSSAAALTFGSQSGDNWGRPAAAPCLCAHHAVSWLPWFTVPHGNMLPKVSIGTVTHIWLHNKLSLNPSEVRGIFFYQNCEITNVI